MSCPGANDAQRLFAAVVVTALAVAVGGCGAAIEAAPPEKPVNLSCVEQIGRRTRAVAAVETTVPVSGPARGASRYVNVRFRRHGYIALSDWPTEAAADRAAREYMKLKLALGAQTKFVEAMSLNVGPSELAVFKSCGVGRP